MSFLREHMSLSGFRANFPEFKNLSDSKVLQYLEMGAQMVNKNLFLTNTYSAHGFITAHLIVSGPSGMTINKESSIGESDYKKAYDELVRMCSPKIMTLGSPY